MSMLPGSAGAGDNIRKTKPTKSVKRAMARARRESSCIAAAPSPSLPQEGRGGDRMALELELEARMAALEERMAVEARLAREERMALALEDRIAREERMAEDRMSLDLPESEEETPEVEAEAEAGVKLEKPEEGGGWRWKY